MRLLCVSTPVGPLGSGLGGGVELTLFNLAQALMQLGYTVKTLAPAGSMMGDLPILEIPGNPQIIAQSQSRKAPITLPDDSVLAQMWQVAYTLQDQYDVLLNFAYDWLPFYLTPFFQTPIAHLVSMGSLSDAMDRVIGQVANSFPGTIGVHSRAQANTFAFAEQCRCLANGFDLSQYEMCLEPDDYWGWVGRLAPEKGLEDAIAAAEQAQVTLKIWGALPDPTYWDDMQARYPAARVVYEGFQPTQQLQQGLRRCRGLLMTPHWEEAFGNVAVEALACGVPVVAYQRGGPSEIVVDGATGWLVAPHDVDGLVEAIAKIDQIDRQACRRRAESEYSLAAMGDRLDAWFHDILKHQAS